MTGCSAGWWGRSSVETVIKHDPDRPKGEFRSLRPLWRVEAAFCELGRWRRLARSFEVTTASATAWMQVACLRGVLAAC